MATWTQKQGAIFNGTTIHDVATDGTDIYYVRTQDDIRKYDTTGNSITQIANSSSFGGSSLNHDFSTRLQLLSYFKSNLYAVTTGSGGTDSFEVWQYDGTGTSWTKRYNNSNGIHGLSLWNDGTNLIAVGYTPLNESGYSPHAFYSSNGTTWNNSSVPIEIGAGTSSCNPLLTGHSANAVTLGIFATFVKCNPSGQTDIYKWNTSTLVWDTHVVGGNAYYRTDDTYHWRSFGGNFDYTTNLAGSWTTPTDGTVQPFTATGMSRPIGYKDNGADIDIHIWNTGTSQWNSSEDTLTGLQTGGAVVRIDDGNVFMFARDGSNNNEIWQRDETLDAAGPDYGLRHSAGGIPGSII